MNKPRKDTIVKIIFVLSAVCLIFAVGLVVGTKLIDKKYAEQTQATQTNQTSTISETTEDLYAEDDGRPVTYFDGNPYYLKENIETILFIGVDASEERDAQDEANGNMTFNQSDVVMLFVIDHDNESYSLIQLNRDTMTEIIVARQTADDVITRQAQLALSFSYGSDMYDCSELTATAVSKLMYDMPIDHYIAITMDSLPILNDQVGGVTVTIPEDMTMDDPAMAEGETITLTGDQAEIFIRAREELEDATNINRMNRQRTYMSAWRQQALTRMAEDENFAIDLILELSNYLYSDMDASALADFATQLQDYQDNGILTIEGENVQGDEYMEFYIDDNDLKRVIIEVFYEPKEA